MTEPRSPDSRFPTSLLEENDGPAVNPTDNRTMGDIIARRFSRRGFLRGSLAVSAIAATVGPVALISADKARAAAGSAFAFDELEAGIDDKHHVAPGYAKQTAEAQARQFGYNNDYVGYIAIDGSAEHGLLVVNHEYTNPHLMFPGLVTVADGKAKQAPLSKE